MYKNLRLRLIVVVILSLVIAFISYKYFDSITTDKTIVIASRKIDSRGIIEASDLKEIDIHSNDDNLYGNVFESKEDIIGKIAIADIPAGTPMIKGNLLMTNNEETILALSDDGNVDQSYFIPKDKRIVTIQVDSTGSINSTLKKGDFVDIIFSSTDVSTGGLYSRMILQHIEIFETASSGTNSNTAISRQNIQLLATPDESVMLTAANRNGILDCILNPLKGETGYAEPFNVLSFNVPPPRSIREELAYILNFVNSVEMTEVTKAKLTESIEEEFSMENVELLIQESTMDYDVKMQLLQYFE